MSHLSFAPSGGCVTDKNQPASPLHCEFDIDCSSRASSGYRGLTAQEYAAIHLKVADSGTQWLDEMIEKSRRDGLICELLNADTIACHPWPNDPDFIELIKDLLYVLKLWIQY